ncbi:P-loop containing nucleoside triphosphate hydrolase protein [Diaporthe sp. PMI_573]|nr:P-loop containing nucleoside triphosphate hydrolase protein [Diaporthaceae sp. PMI_573]
MTIIILEDFKGTEKSETMAHKALDAIQDVSFNPVTLFTLCGTTVEEGPSFWRAPAKHFMKQWKYFGNGILTVKSGNVPIVLTENNHAHFTRLHQKLIHAHADDSATEADTMEKTDAIRTYLTPFVKSLRQNEEWRGRVLNKLPEACGKNYEITPLDDAETKEARENLLGAVHTLITKELNRRKKDWEKRESLARRNGDRFDEEEPTRQDVIETQVNAEKPDQAWLQLSRASSYPYLTVLLQKKLVPPEMFTSFECQAVPVALQYELEKSPPRRSIRAQRFNEWDFAEHAEKLRNNSPKLQGLRRVINEVVNDTDPDTEPKDDPCKARHMVVFVNHTISATVTYHALITDRELCQKIQPILFTSTIKLERRQEMMREMVQPGKPGDRTRVLIAVADIAAEGFNLQRLNNIIFMEIPTSLTKYLQAVGRACRTGQKMKVNIIRMYDKDNLLETCSFKVLMGKKAVSELIYNVKLP